MNFGERGNFAGVEHGLAIKQDDMASDAKSRTLLCECDRFSNAGPFAINVEEVTTPRVWASTMARFTPDVYPKSSALTISRRTLPV